MRCFGMLQLGTLTAMVVGGRITSCAGCHASRVRIIECISVGILDAG